MSEEEVFFFMPLISREDVLDVWQRNLWQEKKSELMSVLQIFRLFSLLLLKKQSQTLLLIRTAINNPEKLWASKFSFHELYKLSDFNIKCFNILKLYQILQLWNSFLCRTVDNSFLSVLKATKLKTSLFPKVHGESRGGEQIFGCSCWKSEFFLPFSELQIYACRL